MTDERDLDPWRRIGRYLRARRAQIDPDYQQRSAWVRDVERKGFGGRVITDLELGERANFSDRTLEVAEEVYQLQPGSIRHAVRTGGDPVPLPSEERTPEPTSAQPDDEPGVIHDERGPGPRTGGLRLGERLRWQVLDAATLEYRLDYDDGSGAAMVVRAGTPRDQVLEWLRADIEMARGMG